ncbi:MAG: GNAT family N-acetyltransferase [Pseudomonadota bacterium]
MAFKFSDVETADLEAVHALNQSEVPHVGSVDIDRMRWFADHADYFQVARLDGELAGFFVGLLPGSAYDSLNYRWFCDHFDNFAYCDRLAVAEIARRRGLATQLYDDFTAAVRGRAHRITCEVNLQPPNPDSMNFHQRIGFVQVGTQSNATGNKAVAFLEKKI